MENTIFSPGEIVVIMTHISLSPRVPILVEEAVITQIDKYQIVTGPMKKIKQNKVMGTASLESKVREAFLEEAHMSRSGVFPAKGIASVKVQRKDQVHL